MDSISKFSDDAVIRFIFAPMILLGGSLFLGNYRHFIEYAYFRSQGRMPGPAMVFIFRMGGAFWVIASVTLLIGLW